MSEAPREELARYQVRTPMALWMVNGALTAFCVIVIAALLMIGHAPAIMVLVATVLCAATVAFWLSMSAYRVGGGRNLIRIYEDRIEIPAVRERKPLVFVRDGLQINVKDVLVEYRVALMPVARVQRGKLIEFRAGAVTRKLSTLVLDDRHDEAPLLGDLQRFLSGEPPLGRAAYDAPAPRTEYDDRIDRELAGLD